MILYGLGNAVDIVGLYVLLSRMRKCTCIGAYEYMYVRNYVECRAPGAAVATAPEPARSLRCDEGFPRSQLLRARASHLTKRPSEKGAEATSCRFANTCHNYTRFLQMYMVAYICIVNIYFE